MIINKKLVVITGASSGIGLGLAKAFSQAGYALGLLARNIEPMQRLNLPDALCLSVDVGHFSVVKSAISQIVDRFGSVDGLVNSAGYAVGGDFTTVSHADHEAMVQVNLQGVINCLEVVLPLMREQKNGTIINLSSVADRAPRPVLTTYAATKAAVKSLSDSLRVANAKFGIRVTNLAPAKVVTPMLNTAGLSDEQVIQVEDIISAVMWLYHLPASVCVRDLVIAPTKYEP